MSIPIGFKYNENMAIYPIRDLPYELDYGVDLENRYDKAEKTAYKERIFCLDCLYYKTCEGSLWKYCQYKQEALKIIRGKL